jgi:hypothetical protein
MEVRADFEELGNVDVLVSDILEERMNFFDL